MRFRKFVHSFLIITVAAIAISGVADSVSQTYAEQALKRALATFAVARTLNGVISVAQGTEIALEPGGVGVMLTPGQILDPVNDLVERFSGVMLVAASSVGLQLILLEILSWWVVTAMLVIALVVWLAALWSPPMRQNRIVSLTLRLTIILTIIRFAVPVVIICTNFLFDAFLLSKHDMATKGVNTSAIRIEEISSQIEDATQPEDQASSEQPSESPSNGDLFQFPDIETLASDLKSSARNWYSDVSDWFGSMKISAKIEQLEESAAQATNDIVNLIVIFVLQTIIFPLAFLWIFVEVLKGLAARSLSPVSGQRIPSAAA